MEEQITVSDAGEPAEAGAPAANPGKFYLVIVNSAEAPQALEFTAEQDFLRNYRSLLGQHAGTGTYIFAFKGSRIFHTEPQTIVGIELAEGDFKQVVLQEPKRNTSGLVPGPMSRSDM